MKLRRIHAGCYETPDGRYRAAHHWRDSRGWTVLRVVVLTDSLDAAQAIQSVPRLRDARAKIARLYAKDAA